MCLSVSMSVCLYLCLHLFGWSVVQQPTLLPPVLVRGELGGGRKVGYIYEELEGGVFSYFLACSAATPIHFLPSWLFLAHKVHNLPTHQS